MTKGTYAVAAVCALSVGLIAGAADAQKSKDTLRSAFTAPIRGVDYYLDPKPDTVFEQAAVYDGLVVFDEKAGKFEPLLAKAWTRTDDKTLEFDLRDDIKWHDGEKFDADDVVYTYGWILDPKTNIRFKAFWNWIDKVEKLGPYKVRITAKRPTPYDLARHAYLTAILPQHVHGPLKEKVEFGQHPIGTGMFKAVLVDKNKGLILERNDAFHHGGKGKPVTNIRRMTFLPIPDTGTQLAEFLAGNLDMVRNPTIEQAENIARQRGAEVTVGQSISYTYMAIDAKGRSGVKPLQDIRVRKALMMGVNRRHIEQILVGNRELRRPGAMCWRIQMGCDYSAPLPAYDAEGAKKLLAEAGYPNGFNLEITTFTSATLQAMAEVAAGDLAKIGIKARVDARELGSYRKKQRDGKIQVIVAAWPAGGFPDVSGTLGFVFAPPPSRDYHGDAELKKLASQMGTIMDDEKRRALGRKVFNVATERAYMIPLSVNPVIVLHTPDLTVDATAMSAFSIEAWGMRWK